MTTEGIEAVFLETHNWGKSAKFFQGLGYEIEFATDHNSGQLRNGDGPYVFIAEVPEDREPQTRIVLKVPDKASGGLGGANKTQDVVLKAPDFQSWKFALTSDYGKLWLVLRPKVGADETTPSPVTVERILFGTPSIPVRRGSR